MGRVTQVEDKNGSFKDVDTMMDDVVGAWSTRRVIVLGSARRVPIRRLLDSCLTHPMTGVPPTSSYFRFRGGFSEAVC
jgi:hypothetical protein